MEVLSGKVSKWDVYAVSLCLFLLMPAPSFVCFFLLAFFPTFTDNLLDLGPTKKKSTIFFLDHAWAKKHLAKPADVSSTLSMSEHVFDRANASCPKRGGIGWDNVLSFSRQFPRHGNDAKHDIPYTQLQMQDNMIAHDHVPRASSCSGHAIYLCNCVHRSSAPYAIFILPCRKTWP